MQFSFFVKYCKYFPSMFEETLSLGYEGTLNDGTTVTNFFNWLQKQDIAQWNRQRLPYRGPGFKSQAHHLRFFNLYSSNYIFVIWIAMWKEAGTGQLTKILSDTKPLKQQSVKKSPTGWSIKQYYSSSYFTTAEVEFVVKATPTEFLNHF